MGIDRWSILLYNECRKLIGSVSGRSESLHRQYTERSSDSLRAARHDGCESRPTVIVRMKETDVFDTSARPWMIIRGCFYASNATEPEKGKNFMTKTSKITYTAIFAAIATILMYVEFPLPFMPPFLKVDLSGAVVLIGAFIFGIGPAITMIGIKDVIHLFQTQTGGSGELADFLMLSSLVIVAVLVYRAHKSRKMAVMGCLLGTLAMACIAMLTNYFLLIPFYAQVMPLEAIFAACTAVNPYVTGMQGYLLLGVLPFNLIKGGILTLITMLAYKKLSSFIKSKQIDFHHKQQIN